MGNNKQTILCPLCHNKLRKDKIEREKNMVRALVTAGFSYQQVADFTGYRSKQSISKIIHGIKI